MTHADRHAPITLRWSLLLAGAALALAACSAQADAEPEPAAQGQAAAPDPHGPLPVPTEYMPSPAMLIYSDTRGWRHEEGIAAGNLALIETAQELGLGYYTTQHSEIFTDAQLARFDVVVFNSATGDSLAPAEKAALERWLTDDGALVLIHGSLDGSQADWDFYQSELVGTTFISHPADPQFQDADIVTLAPGHPVMDGLPERFSANDEWYTFDRVPDGRFTVIAGLDESTYSPVNTVYGVEDLRMGPEPADHPIIWSRCLPGDGAGDGAGGGGRVAASALGHTIDSFQADHHRRLLTNMITWTRRAGQDDEGCG